MGKHATTDRKTRHRNDYEIGHRFKSSVQWLPLTSYEEGVGQLAAIKLLFTDRHVLLDALPPFRQSGLLPLWQRSRQKKLHRSLTVGVPKFLLARSLDALWSGCCELRVTVGRVTRWRLHLRKGGLALFL